MTDLGQTKQEARVPAADHTAFANKAAEAIDALHRVLQAWFNAEGSGDPGVVLAHFDPSFTMMTPAGGLVNYADFASGLTKARGARPGLIMEIRDVNVRYVDHQTALVTYHEHQTQGDIRTDRVSTALLIDSHASGIPQWRHLQETWKS